MVVEFAHSGTSALDVSYLAIVDKGIEHEPWAAWRRRYWRRRVLETPTKVATATKGMACRRRQATSQRSSHDGGGRGGALEDQHRNNHNRISTASMPQRTTTSRTPHRPPRRVEPTINTKICIDGAQQPVAARSTMTISPRPKWSKSEKNRSFPASLFGKLSRDGGSQSVSHSMKWSAYPTCQSHADAIPRLHCRRNRLQESQQYLWLNPQNPNLETCRLLQREPGTGRITIHSALGIKRNQGRKDDILIYKIWTMI